MAEPHHEQSTPERRQRIFQLLGLSAGHGLVDAYINFIVPLLPVVRRLFNLTHAATGVVMFWLGLFTNFGQPLFGYITDRYKPRHMLVVAAIVSTVFFGFIGFTRTLPLFMSFLLIGGLGTALYHPQAGALAVVASGRRRGLGMAIFAAGGAVGNAGGYLLAPYLYELHNSLTGLAWAVPVGVIGAFGLLAIRTDDGTAATAPRFRLRQHVLPHLPKVVPILITTTLRSMTVVGFYIFIPLMLAAQDRQLVEGGHAGFYFLAGGAIGGMICGHISDRIGRRGVTIATLLATPPLLYHALKASALPSLGPFFAMLFASGLMLRAAEPTNITHTQELLTGGRTVAASLAMGLSWGLAGLISPTVGKIADAHSVEYALRWIMWLPAIAAIAAFFIPRTDVHSRASVQP